MVPFHLPSLFLSLFLLLSSPHTTKGQEEGHGGGEELAGDFIDIKEFVDVADAEADGLPDQGGPPSPPPPPPPPPPPLQQEDLVNITGVHGK